VLEIPRDHLGTCVPSPQHFAPGTLSAPANLEGSQEAPSRAYEPGALARETQTDADDCEPRVATKMLGRRDFDVGMLFHELETRAAERGGEFHFVHADSLSVRGKDRGHPAVPRVRAQSFQFLQTKLRLARRARFLQRESLELRKASTGRLSIERLWSSAADSRSPSPA
jgi:hypothetical protein